MRQFFRFVVAVLERFHRDDGFRLSASLSYTTLLAVVPVAAVALGIFAAFPAFEDFTASIQTFFANNLLPPAVAERVLEYIDEFARNAGRLTALGLLLVALTAFLLMGTIDKAFNDIWRTRGSRPVAFRILMYWGVMTLGPLVVGASLTITSYAFSRWIAPNVSHPLASDFLLWAIPFALTTLGLVLLYIVVPTRHVEVRHAIIGAIVAAVAFEVMKRGFAAYLSHVPTYATVYGTLAAFPIFLVWIYLSWVVVVLGAEIVALAPDYHHASRSLAERATPRFAEVLAALTALVVAQRDGRPISTRQASAASGLPTEMVEAALERLVDKGFAARVAGERWTLVCDPDEVTIAAVYRAVVRSDDARRGAGAEAAAVGPVAAAIAALDRSAAIALDRPLRSLAEASSPS